MSISKKHFIIASSIAACLFAAGCTSNGDGSDTIGGSLNGGSTGGSTGGLSGGIGNLGNAFTNGSNTPTTDITNNGTALTGNFTCTNGIGLYGKATTEVGSGGLLGGPLTQLLNVLGGNTATQLLNSVVNPDLAIDGDLSTYASFNLTLGLLGGLVTSVDESVLLSGTTVPAGKYAVFAVTFPGGTADVNLLNSVRISTFLAGTQQETRQISQTEISLVTAGVVNAPYAAFLGMQTTKAYDTAQISLVPGVITASVGDAMRVHELCVGGHF